MLAKRIRLKLKNEFSEKEILILFWSRIAPPTLSSWRLPEANGETLDLQLLDDVAFGFGAGARLTTVPQISLQSTLQLDALS